MSKFSEYLELGIISSGMTEKQLARISGFTRSYIALMKNGQRVSPDVEKMAKLLKALNLSVDEYDSLWEEYIRARIGDEVYERNVAVIDFIHSFRKISHMPIESFCQHKIPDVKIIENRLNIEYMIKAIIENESMKAHGFVHIIMQSKDNVLTKILPGVCKNNKELKVDHIVCMERYAGAGMEHDYLYNVRMLKELVPVVVYSNSVNYKVHYYYDHVASRFNPGTLLPYMILTSEYLLCMDSDMTKGLLSKDSEIHRLYEDMFQSQKKHCRELFHYVKKIEDINEYLPQDEDKGNVTYSVSQQPYFGVLKVSGLVKRYCRDGYEEVISFLEETIKKNEHWVSEEGNKHIAYCSRTGLCRFVQEGLVDELPKEIYHPLNVRDRKRILQMLLEKIEDGSYELYLVEDEMIQLPAELFVTAYSISNVILVYLSEQEHLRILLAESSLTRALYESLGSLMKNPQISTVEIARIYIEELLNNIED